MDVVELLVEKDKQWLLALNNGHDAFSDIFWWNVSLTWPWLFALVVLAYFFVKRKRWEAIGILCALALCVALADQLSSGVIKPMVERFRPTHEPSLAGLVETVKGYEGGRYGFVSSHAANTFAVALFVTLVTRCASLSVTLFLWAALTCYSRVYLGVHYPGDILFGSFVGLFSGWTCYALLKKIRPAALSGVTFSKTEGWLTAAVLIVTFFAMAAIAFVSM